MNLKLKKYPAKILLFGEYSIIKDSSALAFPLMEYSGNWDFDSNVNNKNLKDWTIYIKKIQQANIIDFQIDTNQFCRHVDGLGQRMIFESLKRSYLVCRRLPPNF